MDCLEKGIEVEFAQKKCETLVPLMRKKNKTTNIWMYVLGFILSIIVAIIFAIF